MTRRIDMVSRRESKISIEDLDSSLFPIPGLIDYRAGFDGRLSIEARTVQPGMEKQIQRAAEALYPDLQITVAASVCQRTDRPMYLGKRHIL